MTKGFDIHLKKAMEIFNKPAEQITKEERQVGKRVNYILLYGAPNQELINKIISGEI